MGWRESNNLRLRLLRIASREVTCLLVSLISSRLAVSRDLRKVKSLLRGDVLTCLSCFRLSITQQTNQTGHALFRGRVLRGLTGTPSPLGIARHPRQTLRSLSLHFQCNCNYLFRIRLRREAIYFRGRRENNFDLSIKLIQVNTNWKILEGSNFFYFI